jgi:homoserine O-acetyltransferase
MISAFTKRITAIARAMLPALAILQMAAHPTTKAFAQTGEPVPQAIQHDYTIKNFATESAAVLPEAHIVYGTYGTLDPAGDNAVLLPSHYMANLHGYEWLIGPGKALDPGKLFLVTSELFGNGRSSSPSNTPKPFHGPDFPVMTIRDNVRAVHTLLVDALHIQHLRAVIGFSMGAQQALQWAVS